MFIVWMAIAMKPQGNPEESLKAWMESSAGTQLLQELRSTVLGSLTGSQFILCFLLLIGCSRALYPTWNYADDAAMIEYVMMSLDHFLITQEMIPGVLFESMVHPLGEALSRLAKDTSIDISESQSDIKRIQHKRFRRKDMLVTDYLFQRIRNLNDAPISHRDAVLECSIAWNEYNQI